MRCFSYLLLGLCTTVLLVSGLCVSASEGYFNDLEDHWAKENVERLAGAGLVQGDADGNFNPDTTITVAEFIAMIVRTTDGPLGETRPNEHWAIPYFQKALNDRLVIPGEFDGFDKSITRGEMAVIILRANHEAIPENFWDCREWIIDFDSIHPSKQIAILQAFAAGIFTGYPDGTFQENQPATRAEAAVIFLRLLEPSERVIPDLSQENSEDGDWWLLEDS